MFARPGSRYSFPRDTRRIIAFSRCDFVRRLVSYRCVVRSLALNGARKDNGEARGGSKRASRCVTVRASKHCPSIFLSLRFHLGPGQAPKAENRTSHRRSLSHSHTFAQWRPPRGTASLKPRTDFPREIPANSASSSAVLWYSGPLTWRRR